MTYEYLAFDDAYEDIVEFRPDHLRALAQQAGGTCGNLADSAARECINCKPPLMTGEVGVPAGLTGMGRRLLARSGGARSGALLDAFLWSEDYPSKKTGHDLTLGVPFGTFYAYVSSTFLSGLVNYAGAFRALMSQRYLTDEEWEKTLQEKKWEDMFHFNALAMGEDVHILGETEDSHWWFWYDPDNSDCCVGRLPRGERTQDELWDMLLVSLAKHRDNPRVHDLGKPSGWIGG